MLKLILPAIHLFGLVGFILYKVRGPFFEFMRVRQRDISEGLNRSRKQAQEAAERKREIESKLGALDREKETIAREWKEKLAQQGRALEESSVRIIEQMKREADQNRVALEAVVRKETVAAFRKAVLARAQEKIETALDADVHARLHAKFAQDLSGGGIGA
jgi:F0F1-type ATP synthase membrane subunit b/b'